MKQNLLFILAVVVLIVCSACQKDISHNFSMEYNPLTDFQYNLEYDDLGLSYITESPDGFYFIDGIYLYYMDKETLSPVPLCKKADCLHDKETDPYKKSSCEAFLGGGSKSIFYYDRAIYLMAAELDETNTSFKRNYKLKKYSLDGNFIENVYTFQQLPHAVIRHRGVVYYTFEDIATKGAGETSSTFRLFSYSLQDGEEKEISMQDFPNATLDKLFAYGKYLYIYRYGLRDAEDENSAAFETIVYDIEQQTYQPIDAKQDGMLMVPSIYDNSLMYGYGYGYQDCYDDRTKDFYRTNLDGTKEEIFFEAESTNNRVQWDESYLYADNRALVSISKIESERVITVYNSQLEECDTISFKNIENNSQSIDFSGINMDPLRISDDFIFTKTTGLDGQGSYLICIDKAEIGTGNITPRIIWQKEAQYQSEEYILDTQ